MLLLNKIKIDVICLFTDGNNPKVFIYHRVSINANCVDMNPFETKL